MDGTVLVADDDRTIRTVLTQALTRAGCKVQATSSLTTLIRWVGEGQGDAVITDVKMPDGNGLELLPRISELRPDLPVIVISAQNTIMTAIKAAEAEAFDYLPKPFDLPDLMKRTAKALEIRQRPTEPQAQPEASDLPLVGRSPAMQSVFALVARVLNADLPVLIFGESGTGKSLVAKVLHQASDRANAPFVALTETRLVQPSPVSMLAEELGRGTALIEDVAALSPEAQARLVELLEFTQTDGPRYVATSREDLASAVAKGKLRDDLFFRLDGAPLQLPPLRQRVEDILLLAEHFLASSAQTGPHGNGFTPDASETLRRYSWPGNVRQLENTVARLALTADANLISKEEVEEALAAQPGLAQQLTPESDEKLSESIARHLQRYFDLHGNDLPPPGLYARILKEMELPLIDIALDATGGNQAKCADLLGINRNTLRKKITDLDIHVTRRRKLM